MSKAMTFEEWFDFIETSYDWKMAFDKARVGMIPEDQAVRIPDVGEWCKETVSIDIMEVNDKGENISCVGQIFRPVPVWVPKVGDAVFVEVPLLGGTVSNRGAVALVTEINNTMTHQYSIKHFDGGRSVCTINALKPFDASKIGKPWGEI